MARAERFYQALGLQPQARARTGIRRRPPPHQRPRRSLHKTILDECWRPAFARYLYPRYTGLRRELDTYLDYYNHDRAHTGRHAQGRIPADIIYRARKWRPDEPTLSAHPRDCPF